MSNFAAEKYKKAKMWISLMKKKDHTWDEIKVLCTSPDEAKSVFNCLQEDELIIPDDMEYSEWAEFVSYVEQSFSPIENPYGLDNDEPCNTLPIPIDPGSPWVQYRRYLLGEKDGKRRMDDNSVDQIEKNSHWVLNHLLRDTRVSGPRKGLVMGSVQSGKTANMIGLACMTAHYDWNFIIILSGTIDNLRKQTRDRFKTDLIGSGGVSWHILDKTGNPDYLIDIDSGQKYLTDDLELNAYKDGSLLGLSKHRYVTVCLKNSTRLRNLIKWLHSDKSRAARLRILVIDDEADQASVNTHKMDKDEMDEELLERTAVNQLIIDLVNGKNADGTKSQNPFQAMNYISFTATPYANVLNESFESSLYPKDFICSLPESKEYFGAKVIFGSDEDEKYPGLDIVRDVSDKEVADLKNIHDGNAYALPTELKKSVCWFLCAAAVLRNRGHKKPISMLIHNTAIQNGHFAEYEIMKGWFKAEGRTGSILKLCESVYEEEKGKLTKEILRASYPDYSAIDTVVDDYPTFRQISDDIQTLISNIVNIQMGDDKETIFTEDAIHLCVDNCKANKVAEEGTFLRIIYPDDKQLSMLHKAPVFIVLGGNTLARGLTIEGLVCTYFGRNSNLADTLMQMGRWFGYRRGYEVLQRIWMPKKVKEKFELLEKIDEKLKKEFEEFMDKGRSPGKFGPKITTSATIAKFLLTSKNKSQHAVECDYDFSGDSYETTQFEDDANLTHNIDVVNSLLNTLGTPEQSEANKSAYVWYGIDFSTLEKEFFADDKYHIYKCSSLSSDIPVFLKWMKQMNSEGKYLKWNVAVAGDGKAESRWNIMDGIDVGKIERSKKNGKEYIDIGSLRSGSDALCDVRVSDLSSEQRYLYDSTVKSKKHIISNRGGMGLEDTPLLLFYRIDKDLGKDTVGGRKQKLNSKEDIIGFSIIIAGDSTGGTHARAITVEITQQV